jgi:hypothetical protein
MEFFARIGASHNPFSALLVRIAGGAARAYGTFVLPLNLCLISKRGSVFVMARSFL